jgi:hypothetical protein
MAPRRRSASAPTSSSRSSAPRGGSARDAGLGLAGGRRGRVVDEQHLLAHLRPASYNRSFRRSNVSWRYLACATEAVLRAGAIQRARYGQEIEIQHKGTIDLVTEVDRACETAVLSVLRSHFPEHDIVTEESVLERSGSRFLWFVDPLDGTTNFAHGYPFFCCSVGLAVDGVPVAGAVYDPLKDELFTAERGGERT